jgi:hypothetical protein
MRRVCPALSLVPLALLPTLYPTLCAGAENVSSLTAPGSGTAIAAIAELPESHASSPNLMRELVRLPPQRRADVVAYLSALERFATVVKIARDQNGLIRVGASSDRNRSDATKDVLRFLGCSSSSDRTGVQVRCNPDNAPRDDATALKRSSIDIAALDAALIERKEVSIQVPTVVVPLPLSFGIWTRLIFDRPPPEEQLLGAILAEPKTTFLYEGLLNLDPETLDYFAKNPEVVARLYRRATQGLAAFGRSIHIRGGVVAVPGGDDLRPAWEEMIGESTKKPQDFLPTLLTLQEGRVGFLFDAMAYLPDRTVRFLVGATGGNRRGLSRNLARVYESTEALLAERQGFREYGWPPFVWPLSDPFPFIRQLQITEAGKLSGPTSKRFWTVALDDSDLKVPSGISLTPKSASDEIDGLWLLQRFTDSELLNTQVAKRDVTGLRDTMSFAQRVFGSGAQPVDSALIALKGFRRFPAALLLLERAGVRSATIYSAVTRKAAELTELGDDVDRWFAVTGFQAGLGLIERLAFAQAITQPQVEQLVGRLAALPVTEHAIFGGRLAGWVRDDLGPAVQGDVQAPTAPGTEAQRSSLEPTLLLAAAGSRTSSPTFSWEGRSYRVTLAASLAAQMRQVRSAQEGPSLDMLLNASLALSTLESPAAPMPTIQEALSALDGVARSLETPVKYANGVESAKTLLTESVRRVQDRIRRNEGPDRRALLSVMQGVDAFAGEVLRGVLYAITIHDADAAALLDGDVSFQHELTASGGPLVVKDVMWKLPSVPDDLRGRPWHLQGCICNLDLALADLPLRRLTNRPPDTGRTLRAEDHRALVSMLALVNPYALDGTDMKEVATAAAAGRTLLGTSSEPSLASRAAAAGVSGVRWHLFAWSANRTDAVDALITRTELYWLGRTQSADVRGQPWGVPMPAHNGCLCLSWLDPVSWEYYAGRTGSPYLGAATSDIMIQTATLMAELNLPPILATELLPRLVIEVIDHAPMSDADDWLSTLPAVTRITRQDVERLISDLTATDRLTPVDTRQ